jgi:hypothetical protein
MGKQKRKLSARERAAKKKRNREFMTIFINGKQKRVRREPTIDGIPVEEFIARNADPLWLHQNERWDEIQEAAKPESTDSSASWEDDIPF